MDKINFLTTPEGMEEIKKTINDNLERPERPNITMFEEVGNFRPNNPSPYRAKINDLKARLKEEQTKMEDLITNLDPKKEAELPQEEQDKNKQTFKDTLAVHRANIKALTEQLKLDRMNKRCSNFFQFIPNTHMNRTQARRFRRTRK